MKFINVVLVTVLAMFSGSLYAKDTIIMVTHGQANDSFWNVVKNGAEEAAKQGGAQFIYRAPETFDMVAMSQLIDAAVNQKPSGLVISIPDASALKSAIKRAVDAGITVISMNSGSDVYKDLGVALHVGQDEQQAGFAGGQKLKEMGGKNAICVNMEVGNVALDLRCAGFAKGFGGKSKVLSTGNDPAEVAAKVQAALESDPGIDTILGLSAPLVGEPAVSVVKKKGLVGKVRVATFDMSANFLKSVAAGDAAFCIDQQQYLQGYIPVDLLILKARYGLLPASGVIPSGPNLITKDKAAQVISLSAKGIR